MKEPFSHKEAKSARDETREDLYEKLEAKIDIIKDIWSSTREFLPPSSDDTPGTVRREEETLSVYFTKALGAFPHAKEMLAQYDADKQLYDDLISKKDPFSESEQADEALRRIEKLLHNNDFRFVLSLRGGLKSALNRRQEVRAVLRVAGTEDIVGGCERQLPEKYKDIFASKIRGVREGRFSVGLIVEPVALESAAGKGARGFHAPHTPWNFTREETFDDKVLEMIFGRDDEVPGSRQNETVAHEDFHSFIEGFSVGSITLFDPERIKLNAKAILRFKKMQSPDIVIKNELWLFKRDLLRFQNCGQEELLAEIVSIAHEDIPSHTFASTMDNARLMLISMKGRDPDIDTVIGQVLPQFDVSFFRNRLQRLYRIVEKSAPERIEDLDAALVLFPPSKLQRVESIVERWTQKKDA